MMEAQIRILVVNTDPVDTSLIRTIFEKSVENLELMEAASRSELKAIVTTKNIDLVLIDFGFGESGDQDIVSDIRELGADIPIVLLTDLSARDTALQAIELGVADCVIKSFKHLKKLPAKVVRLIERRVARQELS